MKEINVGLIGFGVVGSGVVKVFNEKASLLEKKSGIRLVLKAICDKDITTKRDVSVDKKLLTRNVNKVLNDDDISIVIELIGGIKQAKDFILQALRNKKHVVCANKALLAEEGEEIFNTAYENGVDICYEASVAGGIPIIRVLREGLIANRIENIFGIINGTSNYILTQMTHRGCDFKTALYDARKRGYAETDPSLDINGIDSAHKITILARICFDEQINFKDVYVQGISNIDLNDIRYAEQLGFCIKLLAIAKKLKNSLQLRVHPTLLPKKHLLADINGIFNAVYINADLIGETLLYGQGAGQLPTASAVVSDVVYLAKKISQSGRLKSLGVSSVRSSAKIQPIDDILMRYYLRFSALDKPAVLSKIATILGNQNISIHSVIQHARRHDQAVPVVMMTHEAKEKDLRKALVKIDNLSVIKKKTVAIRVERL